MGNVSEINNNFIENISEVNVVIAFGGAVSSGKSSLLNRLLGEKILPVEVDAATSLPTYIMKWKDKSACVINNFDQVDNISVLNIKDIAHNQTPVPLKGTKSLFIGLDSFEYEKTVFLDTPGYSKHDLDIRGQVSDKQMARQSLNSADAVIWAVSAESGVISEADLSFLSNLRHDISKIIVITKSDKKSTSDIFQITKLIKQTISLRKINASSVIAVSSRKYNSDDFHEIRSFIENNVSKIKNVVKYSFEELIPGDVLKNEHQGKIYYGIYIGDRKVVYYFKAKKQYCRNTYTSNASIDTVFVFFKKNGFFVTPYSNYCRQTAIKRAIGRIGFQPFLNSTGTDFIDWCTSC